MHFSVHVFVSVFLWLFFFACRVDQKKKSAQWHLEPSQKVRAQFEWASQNTWSVTTNKWNLSVSFTLNFSLSSYETIVRYAINLQTSLIWRKCFRGQEGLVTIMQSFLNPDPTFERLWIILPRVQWSNKILLVNTSIYLGGRWLTKSYGFVKFL